MPATAVRQGVLEVLGGRRLRYAVAVLPHERGDTMTLDELAAALAAWRYGTGPEPRKAISDALRWELHRGRAIRVGRGRYRSRGLARSTHGWMRANVLDRPAHPLRFSAPQSVPGLQPVLR
jgi:hypothetical protein